MTKAPEKLASVPRFESAIWWQPVHATPSRARCASGVVPVVSVAKLGPIPSPSSSTEASGA